VSTGVVVVVGEEVVGTLEVVAGTVVVAKTPPSSLHAEAARTMTNRSAARGDWVIAPAYGPVPAGAGLGMVGVEPPGVGMPAVGGPSS